MSHFSASLFKMNLKRPHDWLDPKYDIVHYLLSGLYIFLLFLCFGVVVRLISQNHWNLRWQKLFHPLLMAGCLIRATFFGLQPFIMEDEVRIDNKLNLILNTLPSFLFFCQLLDYSIFVGGNLSLCTPRISRWNWKIAANICVDHGINVWSGCHSLLFGLYPLSPSLSQCIREL